MKDGRARLILSRGNRGLGRLRPDADSALRARVYG